MMIPPTRNSFDEYYMPLVEIKDFNALINNKPFFDQPVKKLVPQQISFVGKLEEYHVAAMFFIAEKQQKLF